MRNKIIKSKNIKYRRSVSASSQENTALRRKYPTLQTFIIFFLIAFFGYSLFKNITKIKRISSEIDKKQDNLEEVQRREQELSQRLEEVKSDFYIERQIRDELGYAKEGEMVLIMPDDEILRKLAPEIPREKEILPDPNWKKWMKLFFEK